MCQPHFYAKWRGINPEDYSTADQVGMYLEKCWVDTCNKRATSYHLCKPHAKAARVGRLEVPPELGVKINGPCSFEGCEVPYEARKLCHSHYDQFRRGEELRPLRTYGKYIKGEHVCAIVKCSKPATNKGLCSSHSSSMRKYRLSLGRLQELMAVQQCENPGCTNTRRLHIDHDHETGEVRGMLCSGCNTSLGHLQEDIARIQGLAAYKLLHS